MYAKAYIGHECLGVTKLIDANTHDPFRKNLKYMRKKVDVANNES